MRMCKQVANALGEHPALYAMEFLFHMDMDVEDLLEYILLEMDIPQNIEIISIDGRLFGK